MFPLTCGCLDPRPMLSDEIYRQLSKPIKERTPITSADEHNRIAAIEGQAPQEGEELAIRPRFLGPPAKRGETPIVIKKE